MARTRDNVSEEWFLVSMLMFCVFDFFRDITVPLPTDGGRTTWTSYEEEVLFLKKTLEVLVQTYII